MASHYEAPIRRPLVIGDKNYHDVTIDVAAPVEGKANKSWWIVFTIALVAFGWGLGCIIYTVSTGIGVWGLNKTVGWAWDWMGIRLYYLHRIYRYWSLGIKQDRRLGLGYYQLCMVGRYWSCRNFDFCSTVTFPSEVENGN